MDPELIITTDISTLKPISVSFMVTLYIGRNVFEAFRIDEKRIIIKSIHCCNSAVNENTVLPANQFYIKTSNGFIHIVGFKLIKKINRMHEFENETPATEAQKKEERIVFLIRGLKFRLEMLRCEYEQQKKKSIDKLKNHVPAERLKKELERNDF